MTRTRALLPMLAALLASAPACAFIRADSFHVPAQAQTGLAARASVPPPNPTPITIDVYRSHRPPRAFRELGVVLVSAGTEPEDMMTALREAAAMLGGDAIIDAQLVLGGVIGTVVSWEEEPP